MFISVFWIAAIIWDVKIHFISWMGSHSVFYLTPCLFLWLLDYDRKAEDAVDYEDIDEEYDGPEVQAATEEDFLLPRKNFLPTEVSISTLGNGTSVFDDENYDEDDEESEKQHEVLESNAEVPAIPSEGSLGNFCLISIKNPLSKKMIFPHQISVPIY